MYFLPLTFSEDLALKLFFIDDSGDQYMIRKDVYYAIFHESVTVKNLERTRPYSGITGHRENCFASRRPWFYWVNFGNYGIRCRNGRTVCPLQTRRKYIHVGSGAASMRHTVLHGQTVLPLRSYLLRPPIHSGQATGLFAMGIFNYATYV